MRMRPTLRQLLRLVRVVLACLVLGVVASPASARPACTDAVAWVGSASVAAGAHDVAPASSAPAARVATHAPLTAVAPPSAVTSRPAGVRDVVVHRRVYLRHAALLC
jgi:hypothetical protein